jgi:hypothetical protein
MRVPPIEGSDLRSAEPVNGVIRVAGIVYSPHQLIAIRWEVDGFSETTLCEAWRGQYQIDNLTRAGYRIVSVEVAK